MSNEVSQCDWVIALPPCKPQRCTCWRRPASFLLIVKTRCKEMPHIRHVTSCILTAAVLHAGPHSSAQATVTDLQDGLRALDLRIREEVLEHHGELVQQSRHVQALEAAMQSIGGSVSSLQDSIARAQQEVTTLDHSV